MNKVLTFNLKKINIPDKCTGGCHFRIHYPFGWYCTFYWQRIDHIVHAKKCRIQFIKLYKKTGLFLQKQTKPNTRVYKTKYCLDCNFFRDDPVNLNVPWCSLYKTYVPNIKLKFYMDRAERKVARREKVKKCSINYVLIFNEPRL